MITGIHHVQITIPTGEEAQARAFYCGLLGLEEIEKPASLQGRGGFWLKLGNQHVHVGTEDNVDRTNTKAHVAYAVTDLVEWSHKLETEGIDRLAGVPIPGFDRFEFRDPFGNRVEMIQVI